MILGICCTWARIKRAISVDDWFFGMVMALVEIIFELGTVWMYILS